jgi:hypothetical protein
MSTSGCKSNEVTGGLRKLNNKGLHNFYSPPDIIRMFKITEDEEGEACSTHGGYKKCI